MGIAPEADMPSPSCRAVSPVDKVLVWRGSEGGGKRAQAHRPQVSYPKLVAELCVWPLGPGCVLI